MYTRNAWRVMFAALLFIAPWAACGPRGTQTVTVTPTPAALAPGAGDLDYGFLATLETLSSYRLQSLISFQEEGKEADTLQTTLARVREPLAQHLVITGSGAGKIEGMTGQGLEIIRIGGDSYVRFGDEWVIMQIPDSGLIPSSLATYSPENIFGGSRGRYVGEEIVNGVATRHYRYDRAALLASNLFANLTEASGDVWVSVTHNVPVRAVAQLAGKNNETGRVVKVTLRTDLTDINAPIVIAPPAGVEKPDGVDDVPIFPGATDQIAMMGMTSYKVAADADRVTAFYQTEMARLGWESVPADKEGFLAFAKGNRRVQVMIAQQQDRTAVAIIV